MHQGPQDIFRIRVVSVASSVLALAVFKPFGLGAWQWQAYVHLFGIFVLGVIVCMLSDALLTFIFKMPYDGGENGDINSFFKRNLYFQVINTLLITVVICLYRHFLLSDLIPLNRLSWSNFFETLVIMSFCAFVIGLYWRFKFRNRYLAAELEEERSLNAQLQSLQQSVDTYHVAATRDAPSSALPCADASITLTGATSEVVNLQVSSLLYVESEGNYAKVYYVQDDEIQHGMLRATSKQVESELQRFPTIVRCHRAFLVNLVQVERFVSKAGNMQLVMKHGALTIPVSRSNIATIKSMLSAT